MTVTVLTAPALAQSRAAVLGDNAPWRTGDLLRAAGLAGVGLAGLALTWYGASGRADWADELPWVCAAVAATTVAVLGLVGWLLAGLRRVRRLRREVLPLVQAAATRRQAANTATAPSAVDGFVAAPGMTRFHLPTCPLTTGKPVHPVRNGDADRLAPCGVCAA
jgi:hypothetical protein